MPVKLNSAGGGSVTLDVGSTATNFTQTLPSATTTIVGTDTTQTLTNKTIQGGTVISGTAVTTTSGTVANFTGIPSWVKRITVMFSGVSTSGTSPLQIQIGDSGGIETTGYLSGAWTGASNYQTGITTGFVLNGSTVAAAAYHGNITICNLNSNTWSSSHSLGASGGSYHCLGGGSKGLSDVLTQLRITTINGTDTFDAGSINIMYE
jgi:hypothetical protein